MTLPASDTLEECQIRAQRAAELFRLPFRRRTWHGLQGNWQGAGAGSSLDFQDHRPYVPGDDPRYINWQAFARSGHYTMKLYRQEVSPTLDLLIDSSLSMFNDEAKAQRVAELVYWITESAISTGAAIRVYRWRGGQADTIAIEDVLSHRWITDTTMRHSESSIPDLPWRPGSMRVVLSDLLWPGDASPFFHRLTDANGFAIVFAPFSREEAEPSWSGNLEMVDCESAIKRAQRVEDALLRRYRIAYHRHFSMWEDQALRYRVPLARIPSEGDLADAFRIHAGESGAVEWAS